MKKDTFKNPTNYETFVAAVVGGCAAGGVVAAAVGGGHHALIFPVALQFRPC